MEIYIPQSLVLGCNTPHGINVLSDWIEEQIGHTLDLHPSEYIPGYLYYYEQNMGNEGVGEGYGHRLYDGDGHGCGSTYLGCDGTLNYGDGIGIGEDGDGNGHRFGIGDGYGDGYGDGSGENDEYYSIEIVWYKYWRGWMRMD